MTRIPISLLAGLIVLSATACKRDDDRFATATGTSAFLDDASPEAREALSIQVDYILTDANFAKWEVAQRNLDRLPRSAFPASSGSTGGNVIDRAVARLESSPKARTTIEATGLTVRDFVLQTIALAQATEAAQGGRPAGSGVVPPENFRFVDRYRERIRRAQVAARTARRNAESADIQPDSALEAGVDTGISAAIGMDRSSNTAIESDIERADANQRTVPDSTATENTRGTEPTPLDTTRDSLPLEPRQ
jgi:hypothetical protein